MWRKHWRIITSIAFVVVPSLFTFLDYGRVTVPNHRLGCTAYWLDQAKSLHRTQMIEAKNFTGDMMRKLMGSVDSAYDWRQMGHL